MNEYKINESTSGGRGILGNLGYGGTRAVYLRIGVPESRMERICKEDQKWVKEHEGECAE